MDKNKSRTDLLAAGRKKLQQFRQKKDGKGGSSRGKSSKRSGKTEHHESDGETSTTTKKTGLPEVLEGEKTLEFDSKSGSENSSNHSVGPGVDIVTVDPPPISLKPESGAGEVGLTHTAEFCMQEVGFHENYIDSADPKERESAQGFEDKAPLVSLFEMSKLPDPKTETQPDDLSVGSLASVPASAMDTTDDASVVVEMESMSRDKEMESQPPGDDAASVSLITARGDQEADGSDLKQSDSRSKIEFEEKVSLTAREQEEPVGREASEETDTMEDDSQLKQIAEPAGLSTLVSAVDMSDHSLASAGSVSEVPGNRNFTTTIVSEHSEDVSSLHSKFEEQETLTILNLHENEREEDDRSDGMIAEPTCQQSNSEESFVFVGKIQKAPSVNKSEMLSNEINKLPCHGVCKISLSHLAEIMNGLSGEQHNLLLKLRESSSDTVLGTDALISLPYSVPTFLEERLKEELFLVNCTKDILNLQLQEHSNLQMDYDCHIHKLGSEISMLHDELKEAQERENCLTEELENCRSDLQTVISERDDFGNQINSLKAEIYKFSATANALESQLESKMSEFLILSRESAEYKDLVAALRMENKNLNDSITLMTEENKKLAEEKHSFHFEIEKLLKELADCKKLVSVLQESSNVIDDVCSHHITEVQDGGHQDELLEQEVIDNSFAIMNRRLEKAEKISQILEKAIEEWHRHSTSVNKSGDMVAAPAVSRLIQAFESIAHHDENDVEEKAITEDHEKPSIDEQSPTGDSFVLLKEQIRNIRKVVRQLIVDNESASSAFKVEQDIRNSAEMTIEFLKEHSENLEATNLELLILSEAIRQHLSGIKEKNIEVEGTCQRLNEQCSSLKTENSVLNAKLQEYELRTEELQCQLINLQKGSDEISSTFRGQLEDFQKEVAARDLKIKQEADSMFAQILESVDRLNEFTGLHQATNFAGGDALDICGRVTTSIAYSINLIEELKENQKVTHTSHQETINMLSEENNKRIELHGKYELAYETLHRCYNELRELVVTSSGSIENHNINWVDKNISALLDYSLYENLIDQLQNLLAERTQLHVANSKLNAELASSTKDVEELKRRCLDTDSVKKLADEIEVVMKPRDVGLESDGTPFSRLQVLVAFLVDKYEEISEQFNLLREDLGAKVVELTDLQEDLDQLTALKLQHENEILLLKEYLSQVKGAFSAKQNELQEKVSEVEQSEQRIASIREKLSIAVAKGKGLVVQRDSLKQSLAETSSELERLSEELQLRDETLHELEAKLRTYSEAGERAEALESELSYIRNSAAALRKSFLLKDSVIQRVEKILENLDLPEHFHSGDITEKVEWLARSITGNPLPAADWDQEGSVGGSYSDAGMAVMDALKEDVQPGASFGNDLIRKHEELQNKFYGLAEQNEMLQQSLKERNRLVQKWEELLERINLPSYLRSAEPEDTIEWLGKTISEASHDRNSFIQMIDALGKERGSLAGELEDSQWRLSNLEMDMQTVAHEKDGLSQKLETLIQDNNKLSQALSEASNDRSSLFQKIDALENERASLVGELEDLEEKFSLTNAALENSLRNISDLEIKIQKIVSERELISEKVENLIHDNDKLSQSAVQFELDNEKLQHEVTRLNEELVEKLGFKDSISNIHGEISRLQDMICEALQDPGLKDSVSSGSTECLEKMLRKLIEDYMHLSVAKSASGVTGHDGKTGADIVVRDTAALNSQGCALDDVNVLKKQLEDVLNELMYVKEDRDRYIEKQQSLVSEVEALEKQKVDLQELLNQEVQKLASVKEKLNVAVRKGKSVVQQRDGLKQTIEEMNVELEHLKSEIKHRDNTLVEYEQKARDLTTSSENAEALASENVIVKSQLAESENLLHEIGDTLTMILSSLGDADGRTYNSGLIDQLQYIGRSLRDLRESVATSEQEAGKSRRAAELLLAELNEVQDRNEALQEEIAHATKEFAEISKQKGIAEAARFEALSHLERLSKENLEERRKQFSDLAVLNSATDQLRKSFTEISHQVASLCANDLGFLHNLEAGMQSSLNRNETNELVHVPLFKPSTSRNIDNSESISGNGDHSIFAACGAVRELTNEVSALKECLNGHSVSFSNKATNLSKLVEIFNDEMTSQRDLLESIKVNMKRVEAASEEKEREIVLLRKNISLLYEACSTSLMEIENMKSQSLTDVVPGDLLMNSKLGSFANIRDGGESNFLSADNVKIISEELLSQLKDVARLRGQRVEDKYREMKNNISNLQKELQEKDIQRERICMELVSQIKEAEAAVRSYSHDLQTSNSRVHDLEKQVEVLEKGRALLDEKLKGLHDSQASAIELDSKITSLTDLITAKDQEIEALTQALDEEDDQIEDLTKKIEGLEKVLEEKNEEIRDLESSRGKVVKKLSVTVSKFDELHHFSESLLVEVEKLQSQLQDRDAEVSFLRQEVTRCTNDVLTASQSSKKISDEFSELLTWMNSLISDLRIEDLGLDDGFGVQECKEVLKSKIKFILSKMKDMRLAAQNSDELLQIERTKVEELRIREASLQKSLLEKESQWKMLGDVGDSASEVMEIEPIMNKWTVSGTSGTSQVRSLRKANNDQVAIAIDMDQGGSSRLEDEDDEKVHGFTSLTRSRIVPRFTRPVSDMIDGLWVSCDRALMRYPTLRLGIIIYWAVLHALLAMFVV